MLAMREVIREKIEESRKEGSVCNERNYGIDLLRLLSMFMVVILHVLGQGGVLNSTEPLQLNGEALWGIEIACYCAANVFAIISGYVGIYSRHKYSSIISLCFNLIFYSFIITCVEVVILLCNQKPIDWINIGLHLVPSVNHMWYFSAYFCLFFFMPILNSIIKNVPRKTLQVTGAFVLIIFCCWTQVYSKVSNLDGGYSVLWLAIMYLVGGYMSTYKPYATLSVRKSLLGYFICVGLTILSRIVIGNVTLQLFGDVKGINILVSYTSPMMVLAAIFLVNACSKLHIGKKFTKAIAFLSPMAFGVYLIHCHPYIFSKIENVFSWIAHEPLYLAIVYVLLIAFAIFSICLSIDKIRALLFQVCNMKKCAMWIEKIIIKLGTRIFRVLRISLDEDQKNQET